MTSEVEEGVEKEEEDDEEKEETILPDVLSEHTMCMCLFSYVHFMWLQNLQCNTNLKQTRSCGYYN